MLVATSIVAIGLFYLGYKLKPKNILFTRITRRAFIPMIVIVVLTLMLLIRDNMAKREIANHVTLYPNAIMETYGPLKLNANTKKWVFTTKDSHESVWSFYRENSVENLKGWDLARDRYNHYVLYYININAGQLLELSIGRGSDGTIIIFTITNEGMEWLEKKDEELQLYMENYRQQLLDKNKGSVTTEAR